MVKYIVTFFLVLSVYAQASSVNLPDPTKPLSYKVNSKVKADQPRLPKLQSIVFDKQQGRVILNSKSYQTGQRVNGYVIARIEKHAVLLRYADKSYKLTLYTEKERLINNK